MSVGVAVRTRGRPLILQEQATRLPVVSSPELLTAGLTGDNIIAKSFGTYLDNGFIYDQYGNDVTRLMKDLGEDNDGYRQVNITERIV